MALQHLERTPSSMSDRRASRSSVPHSAQHASYNRSITPPSSRDRKPSLATNQNYAVVEACTMDALAAQNSQGSTMSAVRPCRHPLTSWLSHRQFS